MLINSCIKSEKNVSHSILTLKYFSCKYCEELALFQENKQDNAIQQGTLCLRGGVTNCRTEEAA